MIELVKIGVEGFDPILNGGTVKNAMMLINGNLGTGRSTLGLQYLYNGVNQFDEGGLYLIFEETEGGIREAAESTDFDCWYEYAESGETKVCDKWTLLRDGGFSVTFGRILDDLQDINYDRLVLDPLTMFRLFSDDEKKQHQYLLKLTDILKDSGLTSLLMTEQSTTFPETDIGLENFLTDGNIYLIQSPAGATGNRYIWVAKIRRQSIKNSIFPLEVTWGGTKIYEQTVGFSMAGGSSPWFGEETE